jgi:hypothetical protein
VGDAFFLESPNLTLEFRLPEGNGFEFTDPKEALGEGSKEGILSGLGIALPQTGFPARDKIILLELDT